MITISFLFISGLIYCQSTIGVQMPEIQMDSISSAYLTYNLSEEGIATDSTSIAIAAPSTVSIMAAPKVYNYHALGMFCKFDVGLDKGSKIPLRFRLGTVGGVDELERKGPTRYNY